ncbi:MAG: phage/plasmid primase, P4 family [Phycisphaerae bacterium]
MPSTNLKLVQSTGSVLEWAHWYFDRGYALVPVALRSKKPTVDGWPDLRLAREQLTAHFGREPMNVSVLLGEPSGGLIDVDLDHLKCVELADQFLPDTPAIFGRNSKPRSHRIYRCATPLKTKKFRSKSAGMLVELRSNRQHTVFPPSIHESGEPIVWEDEDAEPALVDGAELLAAVQQLSDATRKALGELPSASPGRAESVTTSSMPSDQRIRRCVHSMQRMGCLDGQDGSLRLFAAACRCVEHDLSPADSLAAIRMYEQIRPFPRQWSDAEVQQRLVDADKRARRGRALRPPEVDGDNLIKLGERNPENGRLVLSPSKTLPTAIAYIDELHTHEGCPTIVRYADTFMTWHGNRYATIEDASIRHRLQAWLHDAQRYQMNKQTKLLELVDFDSNDSTIGAAIKAIGDHVHIRASTTPPCWMDGRTNRPDPKLLLPFPSGTLNLMTNEVLPLTPALFNINAIDFEYDPHAPTPTLWFAFLDQLWGDDIESIQLLQEWMGYCLVGDTSQQKILLMIGPKRSGKGTIDRILTRLVGVGNVVAPITSSLAGSFGLQPLLGKSLAIVSDARFGGDGISTVVERLLTISGEDAVTVDRKYLGAVTMKLPTRFMIITNELPRLTDASGALAGRFVMLQLTRSFYGREDTKLTAKLITELPGILLWSIEGLRRLNARGHFVQPASVAETVQDMENLASPVTAFVRESCVLEPSARIDADMLYRAWTEWCERDGRSMVTTKQVFGRDLAAAFAGVRCRGNGRTGRFYQGLRLCYAHEFDQPEAG